MRLMVIFFSIAITLFPGYDLLHDEQEETSIIMEVEGNPTILKKQIEARYPGVEIITTYQNLFLGIALKGNQEHINKIMEDETVKGVYPVQTYQTLTMDSLNDAASGHFSMPNKINPTPYTGKGVKVAVIDTGVDFNHPDLKMNVEGGFDLVDLDDTPMETEEKDGEPTYHGTHVAGIIAADGELKGVAPDSEIYAYRALGPGGMGTSIQVIAAMEEAVEAGVDVMNLSLGNTVNGPDYPTSKAVNEAAKQGVAVVVANGNDGPDNWTIGAPATASSAISVGALQDGAEAPYLYNPEKQKEVILSELPIAPPWNLPRRDYQISKTKQDVQGKIGFMSMDHQPVQEKITAFAEAGAEAILIDGKNVEDQQALLELMEAQSTIPIALVDPEDVSYLDDKSFFEIKSMTTAPTIAEFSSRGPVAVNWMMKPDIVAPGVNIISTVPDGYKSLNGTSMAAPHIAGAIAVIKEAHPDWTNKQIFGALKTTAERVDEMSPIIQGSGNIQIDEAIEADTIIEQPSLSFGKTDEHINERTVTLSLENISDQEQSYHFSIPKQQKGLSWQLPQSFQIDPGEKKEVPISVKLDTLLEKESMVQGWLELENDTDIFTLPYLIVNKTADFPKIGEFTFQLDEQDETYYTYQLYVAKEIKSLSVQLYDPDTLVHKGELASWRDLENGMNEGRLKKSDIDQSTGYYYGLIIGEDKDGKFFNEETEIFLQ